MIADLRALVVLAVIALALVAAVALDPGRPAADDRAVLPGFDPARVRALTWRGEGGALALTRDPSGAWHVAGDPTQGLVDAHAVDDVLAGLRGARWHRRATRALQVRRSLTIELAPGEPGSPHRIDVGERLAGTAQAWIAVDGQARLVDGWLADLLDPAPLAFRDRTPLAGAATASAITIRGPHDLALELHGPPWRDRAGLIAPALGDALVAALSGLELVALGSGPAIGPADYTISLAGAAGGPGTGPSAPGGPGASAAMPAVELGGACPGAPALVAVHTASGPAACIAAAAWSDAVAAIAALARPPADVIDRRPAGFALDHIGLPGATLALVRRPMLALDGGEPRPADPERAAELVAALGEAGEPTAVPAGAPAFTISLAPVRGDAIALDVFGDVVHRRGEALALRISPASRAVLGRAAATLADAERWSEDPSTIRELVLDGVRYRRGAVLGEWTRTPARDGSGAGPTEAALVDAVAAAAASVKAPARAGSSALGATAHHLAITFAPPVGPVVTHELDLGTPAAGGCAATLGGERVTVSLALCTAVAALVSVRP